jgi:transglycosylase-like protein with SLT domain
MRRLTTSTLLFVAFLNAQPSLADSESGKPVVSASPAESTVAETSAAPAPASTEAAMTPPPIESEQQKSALQLSRDDICQMIESAANGEALPFEFLARLIWQESKFNPQAVSPAGAQGIAQFMPRVANGRGLANPFEPAAALHESAEFLRELRDRFGNLGLAAAAYNAGPGRVEKWLARKSVLPRETRDYVHIITGYRPEKWVTSAPPAVEAAEFTSEQCNAIAKLAVSRQKLAALERFADIVSQRLNQKVRIEASVTTSPRGEGRKGILAKRGAQVADTRIEQVTRVVAQSGKRARVEKIIKIVAQRNAAPAVKTAHAAKATQVAEKAPAKTKGASRPLQLANLAKGKGDAAASKKGAASAAPKKLAAASNKGGKAVAKVRVASNVGR